MSLAQPAMPRPAIAAISRVIEEAIRPAGQKTGTGHVNAQVHIPPEVKDVPVDSAQVVVAVANIIANSIESYADPMGPVTITLPCE